MSPRVALWWPLMDKAISVVNVFTALYYSWR